MSVSESVIRMGKGRPLENGFAVASPNLSWNRLPFSVDACGLGSLNGRLSVDVLVCASVVLVVPSSTASSWASLSLYRMESSTNHTHIHF
jgi:hypothetical protein